MDFITCKPRTRFGIAKEFKVPTGYDGPRRYHVTWDAWCRQLSPLTQTAKHTALELAAFRATNPDRATLRAAEKLAWIVAQRTDATLHLTAALTRGEDDQNGTLADWIIDHQMAAMTADCALTELVNAVHTPAGTPTEVGNFGEAFTNEEQAAFTNAQHLVNFHLAHATTGS